MIHAVHLGQGIHQWNVSVAHVQKVIEVCEHETALCSLHFLQASH
jgi:hypothetical protein